MRNRVCFFIFCSCSKGEVLQIRKQTPFSNHNNVEELYSLLTFIYVIIFSCILLKLDYELENKLVYMVLNVSSRYDQEEKRNNLYTTKAC